MQWGVDVFIVLASVAGWVYMLGFDRRDKQAIREKQEADKAELTKDIELLRSEIKTSLSRIESDMRELKESIHKSLERIHRRLDAFDVECPQCSGVKLKNN